MVVVVEGGEGGVQWKKNARVMGGGGGEGWVEEVVLGTEMQLDIFAIPFKQ